MFNSTFVSPLPEGTRLGVKEHVLNTGIPVPEHDKLTSLGNLLPFPRGTASRLKAAVWPARIVWAEELLFRAKLKPTMRSTAIRRVICAASVPVATMLKL